MSTTRARGHFVMLIERDIHLIECNSVITVEPASKASFVHSCMQRRLMGQYNGK